MMFRPVKGLNEAIRYRHNKYTSPALKLSVQPENPLPCFDNYHNKEIIIKPMCRCGYHYWSSNAVI